MQKSLLQNAKSAAGSVRLFFLWRKSLGLVIVQPVLSNKAVVLPLRSV